uniref:Metallophosphoesterase n=1 Tax=Schlesneria paludicola TaxID=360056 RepID=A0A7C2P298_9PLAN
MNGVFLAAWFVASAGCAKLLAVAENMIHGLGLRRPVLQRIRTAHNLLLFSYPVAVFCGLGLTGPELLWRPHWDRVNPLGWTALAAGWIGFVVLMHSAVRYWRTRPPACEISRDSRIVDVAARYPRELVGDGRAKWLARLPRNQQFTLEVNEKTYVLPRLPRAWDGVSIVHFTDAHFRGPVTRRYFEAVIDEAAALQGDLVAFTGDLLDRKDLLSWFPDTLGRLSAPLGCYFVLGNHDWYLGIDAAIRAEFQRHGWTDLAGRIVCVSRGDVSIELAGNERPWMSAAPDLGPCDPARFRVLLSHSPDRIRWARQRGVDLMLAGHTHGGQIRLPILGPVYSPSLHDCRYAAGEFWEPPTLLHVSRGLSGREPIRYNCRPELTKLILRSRDQGAPP